MNSQKPIIIQAPNQQQNLETISQGYPHLAFEQQCKGEEFRQAANQIMLDVASHTIQLINYFKHTIILH